jgi:flagellar motor switch protein FliM
MTVREATQTMTKVDLAALEDRLRDGLVELRTRLVRRCSSEVPCRVERLEGVTVQDVLRRVQGQVGAAIVPLEVTGVEGQGLLVLEGPLIQRLIGRVLGERSEEVDATRAMRPLTRLDLRLVQKIAGDFGGALGRVLGDTEPLTVVAKDPMGGARERISGFDGGAALGVVTFDFGEGDEPWGLAWLAVEISDGAADTSERSRTPNPVPSNNSSRRVRDLDRVMPVPLDVEVELARVDLTLSTIRDLKVGDSIPLGRVRPVTVRIGGKKAFYGDAGESSDNVSVKISGRLSEED